jgi:DNA repair photolyase
MQSTKQFMAKNTATGAVIGVYADIPDMLKKMYSKKKHSHARIYFSTTTDAAQPVPEVERVVYESIKIILEAGCEVAVLTKGVFSDRILDLMVAHPSMVFVQVGCITTDEAIAAAFEPVAETPKRRMEQAKYLIDHGVLVTGRMDPILPGATDSEEQFDAIMKAFSAAGVKKVAASYLFMRPAIKAQMAKHDNVRMIRDVLGKYKKDTVSVPLHGGESTMDALPAEYRVAGYKRLIHAAKQYGIAVAVCNCKNGDLKDYGLPVDEKEEKDDDIEDLGICLGNCAIAGPKKVVESSVTTRCRHATTSSSTSKSESPRDLAPKKLRKE